MNRPFLNIAFSVFAILLATHFIASEAQAKRFGGGASFGSRPSFNRSFKRAPVKRQMTPAQQQATQKNQSIRNNLNRRGGMWGMLGALAMGGLLGSLLFGGAFENFNFLDVVVIGAMLWLLFKLMSRAHRPATSQPCSRSNHQDTEPAYPDYKSDPSQQRAFNTDVMFKNAESGRFQNQQDDGAEAVIEIDQFDQATFLEGARRAFYLLQHAWDNGNQPEIRRMTTDKVFSEIKQQLENNETTNHTEIMSLSAELLSARQVGTQYEVQVLFDANIHELPESTTSNIQEVWHFVKPASQSKTMWFVDGIQQVE
ncbi:MAG: 39S ribosomal protein L45 [Gammaproteobacteria bacterium]|nr:39S ribosomal protein L45 [Gammaproteobacteria bacterium]